MACNYKAFYRGKSPIEIMDCSTSYEAQKRAGVVWNLKPSKWRDITVMLCEKDKEAVTHNPVELG